MKFANEEKQIFMTKYNIWQSGFMTQGDHEPTKAKLLCRISMEKDISWEEVTRMAAEIDNMSDYYNYNKETNHATIWGCGLYDNEEEAKKTFG